MPASSRTRASISITHAEATRLAVVAQRLTGGDNLPGMFKAIGAVQLDTISVLARSHELVPYARSGAVGRPAVERTYWGNQPATAFEYAAHGNCLLPADAWPYFEFRRREKQRRAEQSLRPNRVLTAARRRLKDGPLTASDLGGAGRAAGWFEWSEAKYMLEWLYGVGEAVCTDRRSWRRVYDLPDRVFATDLLAHTPSDEQCHDYLVHAAVRALGVATRRDIADYYWLRLREVDPAIARSELVPVEVAGWDELAWAEPETLANPPPPAGRTTLLSPFDSLIWNRERMRRLFGVVVLLEAYKPKLERVHGYFTMPVLAGDRIVGRVDPARDGKHLVVRQASLEDPAAVPELAAALREAASWVGCQDVRVERTDPAGLAKRLSRALG